MDGCVDAVILIPAAGRSERFRALGHTTPKPLLRVRYNSQIRSMIGHVMAQIPRNYQIMVGLPAGHDLSVNEKTDNVTVMQIAETQSHLQTVIQMASRLPDHKSFVCIDCDTLFAVDCFLRNIPINALSDAVVGITEKPDLSMARVGWQGRSLHYQEPPSQLPFGIVSARYFRRAEEFLHWSDRARNFSNVLNSYGPRTSTIRIKKWLDWGTPDKLVKNKGVIV